MKRVLLTCLAAAALVGCEKESSMDSALTKQQAMNFAPYAGASATRGDAVNSNGQFGSINKGFMVAAYQADKSYFGFNQVNYKSGVWKNVTPMYWPNVNSMLHFAAYSPVDIDIQPSKEPSYVYDSSTQEKHKFSLKYVVKDAVAEQQDLMFAISDELYTVSDGSLVTGETDKNKSVHLHFKHALTQVGFTATKNEGINVWVKSIQLCNVSKEGTMIATMPTDVKGNNDLTDFQPAPDVNTANFCTWDGVATLNHYKAIMVGQEADLTTEVSIPVVAGAKATQLTSTSDVMMLMPQALTAWNPDSSVGATGSKSYLAIDCKITHDDGVGAIIDGIIFVPFDSKDIPYTVDNPENMWKPGYKITYNLNFGGGFTIPGNPDPEIPEPGKTPDPDEVDPTLRAITYSVSVDAWIPVAGGNIPM